MGLREILTGRRRLDKPAPDRLFAMSTAFVTMQTSLGIESRGSAAIVFQSLATADFRTIVADMQEVVHATAADTGTAVQTSEDAYGFSWLVVRGGGFDDLVAAINAVSTAIQDGGYGERLLCAVFAFEQDERPLYWIYNFKRGAYYPFVPAAGPGDPADPAARRRDNERELVLRAQLGGELPVESELPRWYALWGIPI